YGVILVDIGAGNTKVAYFKNNNFLGTSIVDVGGNQITNDLAVGLRIPVVEAERLKKAYGMRTLTDGNDDEEIELIGTNRVEKTVSRSLITDIAKPRCEEIIGLIKAEIQKLTATVAVPCGIVLTGGISLLLGLDSMVEELLNVPVRCGGPDRLEITDRMKNPSYATVVGLLYYARRELEQSGSLESLPGSFFAIKRWFYGIFGVFFKTKTR
ncbi:MAG: rod shape-determining protein, partial [Candidatus Magnetoovum sp. WYHC-5]|nr:rod shape-determining protein [Candidatus Magnetoovum sp. WYHC-5]